MNLKLCDVMSWYPNKKFYKRSSAKSGEIILTVYPPEAQCPVYSHNEWYSDDWDSPFLDLDFERSFFGQFAELQKIAPVVGLLSTMQQNAEYCHDVEGLKNSYVVFDAIQGEDIYYSVRIYDSRSCVDCYWVMDSELLYDCVYMFNCYNTKYSFHCKQVHDSYFLFDCRNVENSFMCSGLRNTEYCIYNKQHTKEEYEEFMSKVNLMDYKYVQVLKQFFKDNYVSAEGGFLENCEEVEGRYVKNSKNCKNTFESFDLRDCVDVFQCAKGSDIRHSFMCNDRIEKCYQCAATGIDSYDVRNCAFVWHSSFMQYCYLCINCQNCFGCIGLKGRKFCVFNKQYSEEEYYEVVGNLIEAMKKRGEYDEFFPRELSPFRFEDTIAGDFFAEMNLSTSEVNYTPQELRFYDSNGIPKPLKPFVMRYKERMDLMGTDL